MKRTDYAAVGETLYSAVLPNGMPIFVMPKPGYRKVFAVCAANYGGVDRRFSLDGRETNTPAGVAHYLEHKMFDTLEGDALLLMNATGADPNAFTSESMTAYHFECVERFEENLRTLLAFVSVPYFTQESVDKERGIIAQEIRMYEDSPDFAVYTDLMKCLFAESPLRDSVAGTVESIAEITPEILYDCHRAFYRPSNLGLCVVGDVDPEAVERIAREVLPQEPAALPERDPGPEEGLEPVSAYSERRMEVAAPIFMIGAKLGPAPTGPEGQRKRLTAALAMRCLAGPSSPFYLQHYSEGLLNSTFGCDVDYGGGQAVAAFDGETSRDPREVFDALCAEIVRVQREGFDPALFERQKKAALGARIRALSNFSGLAVGTLAGRFAGFNVMDSFDALAAVTRADAEDWVRQSLAPERMALSVIYPKEA